MASPEALPAPPHDLDDQIVAAIQGALPKAYVALQALSNYRRVVKVVSGNLNGMADVQKQDLVWSALRRALDADAQYISFVVPYGDEEL